MSTLEPPTAPHGLIEIVAATHARIDGDIVQVDATTWALHGVIAYDGEVLLAEFTTRYAAHHALHHTTLTEEIETTP